jgi:hypothetical protein
MTARTQAVRIGLLVLLGLLAVSAIAGAIWVVPTMPMEWIKAGPFTDWTIPAIALGFVGVLAAAAFILVIVEPWAGALASIVTGLAIVVFEIVEIGVVGWTLSDATLSGFQKSLQLVFLIVGSAQVLLGAVLWLATRRSAPPIPLIHPVPA